MIDYKKKFSLENKTIIITGASSGLGKECALLFDSLGANLLITGRNFERLNETFKLLKNNNHRFLAGDLSDEKHRLDITEKYPFYDGIVHFAAVQKLVPIRLASQQNFDFIYNNNFLNPTLLTRDLLNKNKLNNNASIIFTLSISAHIGTAGVGAYSSMKSGLQGIIRCLAMEQSKRGIRVNGISPAEIKTPMWKDLDVPTAPLGNGSPLDVAYAAAYLSSDASRWVTGTSIIIDGGRE